MDPDAFGSLSAFYLLLEKLWKTVKATNDESMPESFWFLISKKMIEPLLDINWFDPEVIISFDAASIDQLWITYSNNSQIFQSKDFFVIDHHITNPAFWEFNIIDTNASSSCELVYEIIAQMWYKDLIDEPIATLLLAWIHTDTNTFYNKNTTPNTLRVAANLLENGARNKEIIFEFFRKKSFDRVVNWGKILKDIKKTENGKIVWAIADKEVVKWGGEEGFKWVQNEILANIQGADVIFLLYELSDGKVKWSLRSNNDSIDVAEICTSFWGGWHKLAAWFSSTLSIVEVEKQLLEKIKPYIS